MHMRIRSEGFVPNKQVKSIGTGVFLQTSDAKVYRTMEKVIKIKRMIALVNLLLFILLTALYQSINLF